MFETGNDFVKNSEKKTVSKFYLQKQHYDTVILFEVKIKDIGWTSCLLIIGVVTSICSI